MGFFVLCAALAVHLITLYKGGLLEEPWFPVFVGVAILSLSEILAASSAVSPLFNSDAFLLLRSLLGLLGGLFLFLGLYRALRIWRRLSQIATLLLSVRDEEGNGNNVRG